jgi:hypothetical protein
MRIGRRFALVVNARHGDVGRTVECGVEKGRCGDDANEGSTRREG